MNVGMMMPARVPLLVIMTIALFTAWIGAQDTTPNPRRSLNRDGRATAIDPDIPPAALLTKQGRQLADRLNQLRRTESNLGGKHPSLKPVQDEIAAIKKKLQAWAPLQTEQKLSIEPAVIQKIPSMSNQDLKELVIRMAQEMGRMQKRIEILEWEIQGGEG